MSDDGLYVALRGFFAPEQVSRLLGLSSSEVNAVAEKQLACLHPGAAASLGGANAFNYIELKRYMHDQLLRDTDVFSMANSIEVRVPYLDHRVVECAAEALAATKLAPGTNKPLLVNAVGEPLVREAAVSRKRGFTFPFQKWIRETSDHLEDLALQSGLLQEAGVHRCWKHFREGHLHWSRAWALTVLGAEG
jgi:asparagine synthase (glutamine-hydrolysing)